MNREARHPAVHPHAEGVTDHNGDAAHAAALLPPQLLQAGEIIILLLKPSPLFIILAPLKTLTVLVLLTFAAVVLGNYALLPVTQQDIVLLGIAAVGLRLFWQLLEWLSRVYVLTDQRIIRVQGVLSVSVFEARLTQVQHTQTHFTLRERLFGLGTIGFATAGTAFTEAFWEMLSHPLEVHRKVVETLRRYRR